ncbi:hypothetical protein H9L39_19031 [Fusarium oxysporum f. sp. albedinis]|jgi:hypothetical protein|nr:hypothetical protein H9L39_19031 [Fusarium oxysporum f. sp. albedinis]
MIDLALRNPSDPEEVMKMFILPYDAFSHPPHLNTGLRTSTFIILEPLLKLFKGWATGGEFVEWMDEYEAGAWTGKQEFT